MKKAQGISINTIIIAAIALIVLVVLIAIFTGRMGIFGKDLSDAQKGQLCKGDMGMVQGNSCAADKEQVYSNFEQCGEKDDPVSKGCMKPGYVCCTT